MKAWLRIVAALVTVPLTLIGVTSASAGAGHGFGSGGGLTAPGLSVAPSPQIFFFGSSLTRTGLYCGGVDAAAARSIGVTGTDTLGSLAAGQGNVTMNVSGSAGCPSGFTLTGVFVRTGLKMDLVVTSGIYVIHALCVLAPNQTPPATVISFTATCSVVFAGTSW